MRADLVDWLAQVHQYLNLLPETLHLAINLVDRVLSCRIVSAAKLQLVGIAAMLVACKYEETQPKGELILSDLAEVVEGAYSREQILKAERYLLSSLNYGISYRGPMPFLGNFPETESNNRLTRLIAEYLMESTLSDKRFVGMPPSLVASAAMYLSKTVLNESWVSHCYTLGQHF